MMNIVIAETPPSQQDQVREQLQQTLKDVYERTGGDFQSLVLSVVQLRTARHSPIVTFA